ncbi:hypothetical protein XYCOK13_40050 [Xylanibacillus composti]|uniref:Uncharacterized protein n=1 Tax=Xylanibacillus composti TaxID=1572762 RepID=A0A8J4M4U5_9BACL|nr:hypothetical protein XYCOK13_40050 [Xylanibacillus composti]
MISITCCISICLHHNGQKIKTLNPGLDNKVIEYICDFCTHGTVAIITKWGKWGIRRINRAHCGYDFNVKQERA